MWGIPGLLIMVDLERRQQAVSEKSFGGVADTYVQSQYDEESLEPYVRDVLGSTGADEGTHEDTEEFDTDEGPEHGGIFNNHISEYGGGHTYEYCQCGSTCDEIHGQTGNTGQEGYEQKSAAHTEEGSKCCDNKTADYGDERVEGELNTVEGEYAFGQVEGYNFNTHGCGIDCGTFFFAFNRSFESLCCFFSLLFTGLSFGSGFIEQVAAQSENKETEESDVGFQGNLTCGEPGHEVGTGNGTSCKGKTQRQNQTAHFVVVKGRHSRGCTNQPLVRYADGVGYEFVHDRRGLFEGRCVVTETVNGDVTDTCHDTTESTNGGENPTNPDRPYEADYEVDAGASGNPEETGGEFGVDLTWFSTFRCSTDCVSQTVCKGRLDIGHHCQCRDSHDQKAFA